MVIRCDVSLRWSATPAELRALGAALWGWCNRAAGGAGIYQYLDSQALADLVAGKLPAASQSPGKTEQGVHFWFQDHISKERQVAIDRLRREIPAAGVADILVEGRSWQPIDRMPGFRDSSGARAGASQRQLWSSGSEKG